MTCPDCKGSGILRNTVPYGMGTATEELACDCPAGDIQAGQCEKGNNGDSCNLPDCPVCGKKYN